MNKLVLFCTLSLFMSSCKGPYEFDFRKLEGHWVFHDHDAVMHEIWKREGNNDWLGEGYSLMGTDTIFHEFIHLHEVEGVMTYEVRDPKQNENLAIPFKLTAHTEKTLTFENSGHDFPSRIVYVLQSDKDLVAYVEGMIENKNERIDFVFHKAD